MSLFPVWATIYSNPLWITISTLKNNFLRYLLSNNTIDTEKPTDYTTTIEENVETFRTYEQLVSYEAGCATVTLFFLLIFFFTVHSINGYSSKKKNHILLPSGCSIYSILWRKPKAVFHLSQYSNLWTTSSSSQRYLLYNILLFNLRFEFFLWITRSIISSDIPIICAALRYSSSIFCLISLQASQYWGLFNVYLLFKINSLQHSSCRTQ